MNHAELVTLGAKWLFKKKYPIVITELVTQVGEVPDVLGLESISSYLIECKTSHIDFVFDLKKPWRFPGYESLGNYKAYLCPEGLIKSDEVPEGWGLLYEKNGKIRVVIKPEFIKKGFNKEYKILFSLIRRIGQDVPKGISISCYRYETKNNATFGVRDDAAQK